MTGALLLLSALLPSSGDAPPRVAPKWELTLDQSFGGPKGQAPDPKVWGRDLGGGGFGNNELESYTDGAANAWLDGRGHLVIEARKEPTKGPDGIARDYSSARLKTQGKFDQRYGKFEARMMLPKGQGIWPAFWMLGADIDKAGWPGCGEIDVLEHIGREPKTAYATLHGPGYSGGAGIQGKILSDTLYTAFHDYAVEWTPERIVWTFDGKPYHTVEAKEVGNKPWPFEKPQFIILNLAVGGGWPGNPDATTVFPQRLVVDHVRAWRDANLKVDEAALARRHTERMAQSMDYKDPGPARIPGMVRLAEYVDAHDSDAVNEGGAYRKDGVDIGSSGMFRAPWAVGWTKAGEWLTYAVDVAETGDYDVEIQVTNDGPGGKLGLSVDNKRLLGATVPSTGGWNDWQPLKLGRLGLTKGRHTLKLSMEEAGPGGSVGNVAFLQFTKA